MELSLAAQWAEVIGKSMIVENNPALNLISNGFNGWQNE
jgi:hypothetical protein